MARTKASVGAKVSSGKSSKARCSAAPPPSSSSSLGNREKSISGGGGNSVCPRETPKWQRPITNFFICKDPNKSESQSDTEDNAGTSTSKPKAKLNIIESDDEEETPKNQVLDETIELEPLTGDSSHKIVEYYSKNNKGKGIGKKTKDKENVDCNTERRSSKRELEDDEIESVSKKVKV